MLVLFALLATLASGKVQFRIITDTTCSDCQDWVTKQFKPLWEKKDFRTALQDNYNFTFMAKSVTQHTQGDNLNIVLNCAFKHLPLESFVTSLFCWESKVEAWVETSPGSGRFTQHHVNIDGLMAKCMPSSSMSVLNKCTKEEGDSLTASVETNLPVGFNEVPWMTVGDSQFSMSGVDSVVYRLQGYICDKMKASALSACSGSKSSVASFLMANRRALRTSIESKTTVSQVPWSCKM